MRKVRTGLDRIVFSEKESVKILSNAKDDKRIFDAIKSIGSLAPDKFKRVDLILPFAQEGKYVKIARNTLFNLGGPQALAALEEAYKTSIDPVQALSELLGNGDREKIGRSLNSFGGIRIMIVVHICHTGLANTNGRGLSQSWSKIEEWHQLMSVGY